MMTVSRVFVLMLIMILVTGISSIKIGLFQHVLADRIAYKVGYFRGDGPLTDAAAKMIRAVQKSPYFLPSTVVQSDNIMITNLAKKITKGKKTDEEKSKAIYDWITHHIAYDYQEYQDDLGEIQFTYKTALETLNDRKGICMDYARLDAALHRAAGIGAKVVYGEGHAWNQVKLNGVWIDQDPTDGAGYIDNTSHQFVQEYNEYYFSHTTKRWEGEFKW